jgi:cyclo(L-tyrosyl-L-tyrosyl) synthase
MSQGDMLPRTGQQVTAEPYGANSGAILDRGEHAMFGVSTGNSYFSRDRLAAVLCWAAARFEQVDVIYADLHLETMLVASGYEEADAHRSAAKQLRGLQRRIRGAIDDLGAADGRVRARPLSDFATDPAYQRARERTRAAVRTDLELRGVRDAMAFGFVAGRLEPGGFPDAAQIGAALAYVDAELPFFVDTPGILGVPSSVHCYHTVLALGRLLFGDRAAGLRPAANQGYAVVACEP